MRVLLVKMSSLGDVLHTLPALSDAQRARPDLRIDWVIEEAFAEVPSWHPAVARIIPVALRRWRRTPLTARRDPLWRAASAALRGGAYDAVIDAQGLLKSAAVARLVDAPRFGMDRHSAREPLAALAYRHRLSVPREQHAIARLRQLFALALDYPRPDTPPDFGLERRFPATVPGASPAAPPLPLLFLHGTTRTDKLWPEAHWRALVARASAAGYQVWLPWGNARERARAARLAAGGATVLPALSLAGLAERMRHCSAAVAVDTGPGHLAAALGVPAVSLYGPTNPALVGTCGPAQRHLLAPTNRSFGAPPLAAIAPDTVWRELAALLPPRIARAEAG